MRLIVNPGFSPRMVFRARVGRAVNSTFLKSLSLLRSVWSQAFPMPRLPVPPEPPSPIAKAGALREGAFLAENVDAKSDRRIA
jgi:hypothetical protein